MQLFSSPHGSLFLWTCATERFSLLKLSTRSQVMSREVRCRCTTELFTEAFYTLTSHICPGRCVAPALRQLQLQRCPTERILRSLEPMRTWEVFELSLRHTDGAIIESELIKVLNFPQSRAISLDGKIELADESPKSGPVRPNRPSIQTRHKILVTETQTCGQSKSPTAKTGSDG